MNPDCKWKQEEFGYIYLLTRSLASDALADKNPKKVRAGSHVVGYGITARGDFNSLQKL
jgi:hypothetical protein